MKVYSILFALLLCTILCFSNYASGQITDIDGNTYETIKIGEQEWMSENLMVTRFNNGDSIHLLPDLDEAFSKFTPPYTEEEHAEMKAINEYINSIAKKPWYAKREGGYIYDYQVVNGELNVCPAGWRIPTQNDWKVLAETLGGENVAAKKMKSTTGWSEECSATNESGFNAKPYAVYNITLEGYLHFEAFSRAASWWPSIFICSNDGKDDSIYQFDGNKLHSYWPEGHDDSDYIRCIKDEK